MDKLETRLFQKYIKRCWILLVPLLMWGLVTSCGDTPIDANTKTNTSVVDSSMINLAPAQFDAVGTIQGTVIDKATGDALSNVAVTLLFQAEGMDEPAEATDSTNSDGHFSFTEVPVNSDAPQYTGNNYQSNSPYTLDITTEKLDNYRDHYLMNAPLTFEGTGGDGAATNLVSDVTIPLSEQAVKVKGKLQTSGGTILSDVKVKLYQKFSPFINGGSDTYTNMLIDSAKTGEDGNFAFTDVEEDATIWMKFIDDSDPTNVVRDRTQQWETSSASGDANPVLDLGVLRTFTQNESGAFYVSEVTPEPESDVKPDTVFEYHFNRPVADNQYTRTDLGFGNDTFKDDIYFRNNGPKTKSPGDVEFSVSWANDHKTLIIDPDGLVDAHEYTLFVYNAFNNQDFVDEFGNSLVYNSDTPYQNQSNIEYLDFSTNANNAKPPAPKLVMDKSTNTLDYNSGSVDFSWKVDESKVDIKRYEIWVKHGDDAYQYNFSLNRDDITFDEAEFTYTLYYSQPLVILRGYNNNSPEEAITDKVKVRAISDNLRESDFSNELTLSDIIKPDITGASYNDNSGELTVMFDEPMKKSQVENASNYTFVDSNGNQITGVDIESINYTADYGTNPSNESYQVAITVKDPNSLSSNNGETVVLDSGVSDLAGNGMDTNDTKNDNDGHENKATY